ncbi:putative bifunctional diguanylate cyclase/phosphodiesterase [Vibrio sp. WXL103]|uniref:putative bifunctional diguanylate cyclase/phosphodiesterase n=1 Tax=Vibrio sp. WXL103 TaxID=3450710 RepID=UPI003EC6A493
MPTTELKSWFSKFTSTSPYYFAILNREHQYTSVNARYTELSGLKPHELIGMSDAQILGEHFYRLFEPYYQRAFQGETIDTELTLNLVEAETSLRFCISPISSSDEIDHILFHAIDTSEKQILARSLEEAEDKFFTLSHILPEGLLILEDESIVSANANAAKILSCNHHCDLIGQTLSGYLRDVQGNPLRQDQLIEAEQGTLEGMTHQDNKHCKRVRLYADTLASHGQNCSIVVIQDLEQRHRPGVSTQGIANVDPLTGLINRFGFSNRLAYYISCETPLTVLYLDIDNFKNINDSLGHHIGDMVIKEVASRLQRVLPESATLGHLGADEFGVLLPSQESNRRIESLAERIIALINQPFDLHHFSKRLACSIGSVVYPGDGNDARILLQNADTAMYEAKARGRNRLIRFSEQMNKEARMRLWLEIELQKALQQNGLEVWYQPKVSAKDFSINGAEALIRWKHPVEGYISPGSFIPVAEKAGLIEQMGMVVMREVFNTVKRWHRQGILPGPVAINLSPEQFANPKLIEYMKKLLKSTNLTPSLITFELTESAVMSDSEYTIQMLNAIKKLGFALSIDDFGTGYSSLAYLARFPIDELKIDRTFIQQMDKLPKQVTVIENIINLGKSLELKIVAEGVETQHQATVLSNLRCHSIQGFHFYRPQPKQDVEELFMQHRQHKN